MTKAQALRRAIKHIGSKSEMARKLKISRTAIDYWIKEKRVPAEQALEIERVTDGIVTRADLRPDLFGENVA